MVDDRKVPEGYKVTEVGVIPEEWVVEQLETCASIIDPHPSHRAPKAVNNGIPFVGIGDISEFGIINYKTTRYVGEYVYFEHCKRYDLSKKLIGIGRVASIGKVVKFKNNIGKYTISPTIAVVESKGIDGELLYYLLKSISVERQFSSISNGSTRQSVGIMTLRKIFLSFPKNEVEQKAIAEALSDTDSLIQSIEKLIDKKNKIKQGAMQQLLTGKKRLPGFSGEWEVKKLGEIVDFLKGRGLSKSKLSIEGNFKCILYGELFTTYDEVINSVKSSTNSSEGIVSISGDVLIPGSTTTTGIDLAIAACVNLDGVLLGGDINILRPKVRINSEFLARYLSNIKKMEISKETQGITIIHLYAKNLYEINIEFPIIEEQNAIAQALSDMDAEIKALEEKLKKYKTIKQGMMQELLTGRIRLI